MEFFNLISDFMLFFAFYLSFFSTVILGCVWLWTTTARLLLDWRDERQKRKGAAELKAEVRDDV